MEQPIFAVVGHVNKGKSSIVSTLSEDDSVAIAPEPRTTTACREFPFQVDGETLFTLVDTPGFEQARRALAWMRKRAASADRRADTVAAFVREHRRGDRFPEECELLRPILEGAGILYVVDGSRPYSPEYEAEMEILRWTGRPRMAMINRMGERDHVAEWRRVLDQYFSLVRAFDAHQADYRIRLDLLQAFRELREDWRPFLDRTIANMQSERLRRRRQSARAIAGTIADQLALVQEKKISETADAEAVKPELEKQYREALRKRERIERDEIEDLYQHRKLKRTETDLDPSTEDLFAETTWLRLGLDRKQLAATGALGGAAIGGGIDLSLVGASFFAGALLGGTVGALSGWFSKKSLSRISIQGLKLGGRMLRVGPMTNVQFPWIVLDRALIHHENISERAHARRDAVALDHTKGKEGKVSLLSASERRAIESRLAKLRKTRDAESREMIQAELADLIEPLLGEADKRQG